MSFIITITTQEGIVMASDSRLTINNVNEIDGVKHILSAISTSDTNYKTFRASNSIGISLFGGATVRGIPLSGYIDTFIRNNIDDNTNIIDVPKLIVEYSKTLPEIPDTGFHIAGYTTDPEGNKQPYISRVYIANGNIVNVVPSHQILGAIWDGEQDVMARILNKELGIKNNEGIYEPMPAYDVPFYMYTLQDAIDFAVYAVRTTKDTIRFQMRCKTVGGPIDVLIIKPDKSEWLIKKALHIENT